MGGDQDFTAVLGEPVVALEELPHATRTTATRRVTRVRGASKTLIVKVIARTFPGARRPSDPYFAAREIEVYEHGLPTVFTEAGIRLPDLAHRVDRPDEVELWLEDLEGVTAGALTPAHFRRVAHRLGAAQGAPRRGPDAVPWSRGFLRVYLRTWDDVGWDRIRDDDAWERPLMRAHFAPDLRQRLVDLCAQRNEMLGWLDRLPATLCHHDVWVNNVFDDDDHTALIDWSFAGDGALGTDPGNLVTDACGDLLLPPSLLPELDDAATNGYRDGLADAGWRGDFSHARLAMCAIAAKWSWLVPHMLRVAADEQHNVYGNQATSSDDLFAARAAMLDYYTVLAAEARVLATNLGFTHA